jgi:hypothetical protein
MQAALLHRNFIGKLLYPVRSRVITLTTSSLKVVKFRSGAVSAELFPIVGTPEATIQDSVKKVFPIFEEYKRNVMTFFIFPLLFPGMGLHQNKFTSRSNNKIKN